MEMNMKVSSKTSLRLDIGSLVCAVKRNSMEI
jgi:hypothetical protein